jgi:very-short-patch-repair endonuclease
LWSVTNCAGSGNKSPAAVNDARARHLLPADDTARPTRSWLEDTFLRFVARHRLPTPEVNTTVAGYEVDMLWRPQRLVAELDGYETHQFAFETDREKDAHLLAAGRGSASPTTA